MKGVVKLEIKVKLKFEEEFIVNLEDICNEEVIIYTYTEKQLKEIRRLLLEKVDDDELSSEQIKECKDALDVIKNVLYIIDKVNIKNLDACYLRTLSDDSLINLRNSIIKVLNQHIILYEETMLPLYSRMIDVSAAALLAIKKEAKSRNLRVNMTRKEEKELGTALTKWGCKYATTRFY